VQFMVLGCQGGACGGSHTAVAVDATNTQNGIIGTATSYTNNFSFTTAGSDNALLVFLVFEANPGSVTAPTWNSVSLTAISACINNGTVFMCPFGMVNPAIGVHLTLAASWTNSVYASFLFLPASGADTSSIANAFKNLNSANGANATSGQGVTITDGSATPANNADVAITYQNGGATGSVTTGQTDIGFQIGRLGILTPPTDQAQQAIISGGRATPQLRGSLRV
jgi:hypothetical protein